jgi:hypothetical protein
MNKQQSDLEQEFPPPMSGGANGLHVPEISRETIIDLVGDMNRVGFDALSGYLKPADLEDLQQFVEAAVAGRRRRICRAHRRRKFAQSD